MSMVRWLLLGVMLVVSSVSVWGQDTTGPISESLVFVVNGAANISPDFIPTFTRDVDTITVQFVFRNDLGSSTDLQIQINTQVKGDTATQANVSAFTCQRVAGAIVDPDPIADCQNTTIEVPGQSGNPVDTTIQLAFFASGLPGLSAIAQIMDLQVLVGSVGGAPVTTQAVQPIGVDTRERLEFNLNPPPPSVSIEGPVSVEPALPRQGDIVTVSYIVANNRGTPQAYRLLYELKQLNQDDFLVLDFLRIDSNCVRCATSGTLSGNERRVVQVQFHTNTLPPTMDPLDAISVTVQDAAPTTNGTDNGASNTITVFGTVEAVTQFEGDVFVLVDQGSTSGRIWIRVDGPVVDGDGNAILPHDIRVGQQITATVERDPTFEASPIGQFNPAEELLSPYLLRITANPQQTNTINQLVVGFNLREPIRQLVLTSPGSLAAVRENGTTRFSLSVFNDSPLFLSDNFLDVELVRLNPDGTQTLVPLDAARCTLRALSGSLLGLVTACPSVVFDLAPFEGTSFEVVLDTTGLEEGGYQLNVTAGPTGVSASRARTLGLQNSNNIGFRVQAGAVVGAQDGGETATAQRGPELRPIELKIVPSTTVEQGDSLVLLSTIKNSGNLAAENIEVIFSLTQELDNGSLVSVNSLTQFYPRLGIGLTLEARQAFDTDTLAPGRYRVRVEVRLTDGGVAELDPANNVLESIINVVERSD